MSAIAIVGMACRYAEARSPRQLWENVLSQRRSFRRIPRVRLRLEDYAAEGQVEDRIYLTAAAVLEDYEFDRVRFHVSKETFLSTDLAHWLALDTAAQALTDARLLESSAGQRERTGVYIGNSLTGEFSRANLMRLRWPYVRRVLTSVLEENHTSRSEMEKLVQQIETLYKNPFPATTEESLAGGLANTIAGRICNYFNFQGGGYTVDGACASSLLAVTTACSALETGDVDMAIAGGVDLSLDPFELAGFSKLGALAKDKMRVFDEQSSGFWPGEGCGMVVLMRHEDALAHQLPAYALIRGWGVSSDGSGGITRPELSGQMLALRRAYQRAQYQIDDIAYFEGHGTGTNVGDAVELQALSSARREAARPNTAPAAIGSIKANIGHTKAAAGIAGLIKATMAVQAKILPPTTGCEKPHAELTADRPMLRVLKEGELWPDELPVRASVSGMGFGGINTHVTLESPDSFHRKSFTAFEQMQLASAQDCELFLFQAADAEQLAGQLQNILEIAADLSYAELTDLAAALAKNLSPEKSIRAACVASSPEELERNLRKLHEWCSVARHSGDPTSDLYGAQPPSAAGENSSREENPEAYGTELHKIDSKHGIFLSHREESPRIGFLFPGQGSPFHTEGGVWSRRFSAIRDLYKRANLPKTKSIATETAQPGVATASLAGLHALRAFGIEGAVAVGHSLGEITALHWAGACNEDDLLRIVTHRGRVMAEMATPSGTMASIRANWQEVKQRLNGDPLVIAGYNSPRQTVISGDAQALRRFTAKLSSDGIATTMLPVSHAFHSPLVENVATTFSSYLAGERFGAVKQHVVSTVTGSVLQEDIDLHELLTRQITMPVRFADAVMLAAVDTELFIEVGPGAVLSGITAECTDKPVIALNVGGDSLRGLLTATGAAFAMGAKVRTEALLENRFFRPFDLQRRHTFLANPCESIFGPDIVVRSAPVAPKQAAAAEQIATHDAAEILRHLVAQRTELPLSAITPESRFLDNLHLNSITISQIILEAAAQLDLSPPAAPAEYTNASIRQAAEALEQMEQMQQMRQLAPAGAAEKHPQGVEPWTRVLGIEYVEQPRRSAHSGQAGKWEILSLDGSPLRQQLEKESSRLSGDGLLCCVPAQRDERTAAFLLESVQTALHRNVRQMMFVQQGGGASALARTLYLERPAMKVTVVDVAHKHPQAVEWIIQEANCAVGFTEVRYDQAGVRREPRLTVLWPEKNSEKPLTADDLLLVTGGGKGIAAECALQLAREFGCRLALLGRSDPAQDAELKQNLQRFTETGVSFRYCSVDVTDAQATARVIQQIQAESGTITAVLHGAGMNLPRRLGEITASDMQATLAPKITGLENILSNIDPGRLRMLLTFGSIIGRAGLHGEGHYALANDWMNLAVEKWQREHSHCRCMNLEWSVWAGTGMGQRLGVLESLLQQGITPLPIEDAISTLKTMMAWKEAPVSSIVAGRFGNLPTLQFENHELPLLRYLEHVQVHYPGIELVADAELSTDTDPYLADHSFKGEQLLPAVCGIEAMAQVAMVLEQTSELPEFQNLRFEHPIVVPARKPVRIRVAALKLSPEKISVVIRCSTTSFQVDHFSGECVFHTRREISSVPEDLRAGASSVPLDPSRDLYGGILFHAGRFRRVERYRLLLADRSVAELNAPVSATWYARHLPGEFLLGNAASRDAALHSIQACIPHKTILPTGIDRIIANPKWTYEGASVHAMERLRDGENFIYDLWIQDAHGNTLETWEGLHLRAVAPTEAPESWPLALLPPYLERKLDELTGSKKLKIALAGCGDEIASLVQQMAGAEARISHRPDGKPEIPGAEISFSHNGPLTLIATGGAPVGCDLEQVVPREWEKLLGEEGFALAQLVSRRANIDLDAAGTQMWTIKEGLRKCGASFDQQWRWERSSADGWSVFSAHGFMAATFSAEVQGRNHLAFGFVVKAYMEQRETSAGAKAQAI